MQKSGTKGGPYGFAVAMSQYRKPGASRDIFRAGNETEARNLVKKLASKYGLTKDEMSGILIESQHVRARDTKEEDTGRLTYLHGLEQQIFTSKFTMNAFGEHVAAAMLRGDRQHMKEVLQKIYLESEGASARAEVRSEPMPTEDPISVGASVVDMDEPEPPPEALAAANLDERLSRADQRSAELLRAKRKKGAVRGSGRSSTSLSFGVSMWVVAFVLLNQPLGRLFDFVVLGDSEESREGAPYFPFLCFTFVW